MTFRRIYEQEHSFESQSNGRLYGWFHGSSKARHMMSSAGSCSLCHLESPSPRSAFLSSDAKQSRGRQFRPRFHADRPDHRRRGPAAATGSPSCGGFRPVTVPTRPLTLNINGKDHQLTLEPRVTLLDASRESAGLTGTKKRCDRRQCGDCTVLVDGRRINASLTLAITHQARRSRPSKASPKRPAGVGPGGAQQTRCLRVWLLYPGPDLFGRHLHRRDPRRHCQCGHAHLREQVAAFTVPEIRERMSVNL